MIQAVADRDDGSVLVMIGLDAQEWKRLSDGIVAFDSVGLPNPLTVVIRGLINNKPQSYDMPVDMSRPGVILGIPLDYPMEDGDGTFFEITVGDMEFAIFTEETDSKCLQRLRNETPSMIPISFPSNITPSEHPDNLN